MCATLTHNNLLKHLNSSLNRIKNVSYLYQHLDFSAQTTSLAILKTVGINLIK